MSENDKYGPYGGGSNSADPHRPDQHSTPAGSESGYRPEDAYGTDSSYGTDSTYGTDSSYGTDSTYGTDGTYGTDSQSGAYGAGAAPYGQAPYGSQQQGFPQYAAASQGYQGGAQPTGTPPKRTVPVLMIVLGFLTMILAPIIGLVAGVGSVISSASTSLNLDEGFYAVADGEPLSLPGNETVSIISAGDGLATPTCTVLDPQGGEVPVSSPQGSINDLYPQFTTTVAGDYAVNCGTSGEIALMDSQAAGEMGTFIEGTPGGLGVPILIGMIIGFLGLVVGIIGIVLLVRVNRRRRELGY